MNGTFYEILRGIEVLQVPRLQIIATNSAIIKMCLVCASEGNNVI